MTPQRYITYFLLVIGVVIHTGCENNLKEVEKVSFFKTALLIDVSKDVEIIYSDSAIVKAKILAPELLYFRTAQPYYEMKKGVTAIFFNSYQQETSRVVADYAIQRESQKLIELRKNVVATNEEGKIFKSDELIWDSNHHKFYSNKQVAIITPHQTVYGTKFWANEKFTYYEIQQSTGNFDVSENTTP